MPAIDANGISLEYESHGSASNPTILLIMGLGMQLTAWPDAFCDALVKQGFRVIRFDNRDIGLSTKFPQLGTPDLGALFAQQMMGKPITAPYELADMAADAVGLLDALKIERSHVVGASMGGAIGQELAIRYPDRLRTLTSIMSSTGDPGLSLPTAEALGVLMAPAPKDRESYFASYKRTWAVLRGPGFPQDEARDLDRAAANFDRGLNPPGVARQLAAILASGGRKDALKKVRVPTLVIHGSADPLVSVEGGKATAQAIPGAKLLVLEGMGHALPMSMWPRLIEAIAGHAR